MVPRTFDLHRERPSPLSRFLLDSFIYVAGAVPPRSREFVAGVMAAVDRYVSIGRREGLAENLERLASWGHPQAREPKDRDALARAIFRSYHLGILEHAAACRRWRGAPALRLSGTERLYRALHAGRGVVLTSPHLGNWERTGLGLAHIGFRLHAVTGVQFHPAVAAAVRERKERAKILVSTPRDGFLPLLRTLRAGGIVLLLSDGDIYARAATVRFFGAPTPIPIGPALLARRANAPIVHGYGVREPDGRDHFHFESLDYPDHSLSLADDLTRMTEGVARAMERAIAAHPAQWCIFRPLVEAALPVVRSATARPAHVA